MSFGPKKPNPEELIKAQAIWQAIADLESTEGWGHFCKAVDAMIEREMPSGTNFDNELAVKKLAYINGVKDCVDIVRKAKDSLK